MVDAIDVLNNLAIGLGTGSIGRGADEPLSWLSPSSLLSFSLKLSEQWEPSNL